jgi:hypothetical protein
MLTQVNCFLSCSLLHSNISLGRSVKNTGNLAVTFRSLNDILLRNKVRQTVRMTERHEKKGAKRRRLQSERWRKQFANEVGTMFLSYLCASDFFDHSSGAEKSPACN